MEDVAWRNERSIFKVMPQHRVNIGILFDIAITKKETHVAEDQFATQP